LTLSIGIATGQRAPGLTSLLNTLMSQCAGFSGHVEIIVLDDSADADTRKLVESYQPHFPVNYLSNAQAIGLAGNLQAIASRLAKGVFTWLIGDGDLLRQNAVQEILAVIAKSPDLHFILTNSLRGTKEELAAKATDTLVSSDGFLANGPTQIASALDRPAVKFDELLAPICAEEILGTVGGAVFRTATWREFQASAPAAAALMATYPLALTFAHTMVGRAAYYLAYPVRISSGEARTRLVRTPQDILQRLPELLAFYAAKGVAAKQIIACRFELARFSREALRARLLDADTPGLADFDLRKFIAENHVGAHLMFDYLDDIVQEAALQAIGNPMLDEAQALGRQYPSQKIVSAAPVAAPLLKSVEAFQVSVQQAEEFLRTGAIREAVAELERARSLAPNAECGAKAAQVLEMLRADPPPVPNTPENIFSAEERTNILGIIAAFGEDPSDAETVSQLRALKTGLADFLKNTDPAHIRALFRNDFGQIFQEVIALSLGDDPVGSTLGDLLALVESGFAASAGSVAFDPRPQLTNLLLTSHVSRPQPSHVYQ
jgi:hypothetical protein